jgi:peptide/nickel transport system permease protein
MSKMTTLLFQRLALGCLSLWFVSLIILLGVNFLPGDIATEILGQSATPEAVAAFRHTLGLDQSLYSRYVNWLGAFVRGDFGTSLANGRQIAELLGTRLLNTLFLAMVTALISVPLALGLGFLAAMHRNGLFDRMINSATLTFISFPEFFLAYLLILLFSVKAGWLPSLANVDPSQPLLERLYRVTLPAFTLTLVVMAHMMRMTRAAIINLLASPYIEMAMLKGMPGPPSST